MRYRTIDTRMDGHIGVLAFARERVLNAFDATLIEEVNAAMAGFAAASSSAHPGRTCAAARREGVREHS